MTMSMLSEVAKLAWAAARVEVDRVKAWLAVDPTPAALPAPPPPAEPNYDPFPDCIGCGKPFVEPRAVKLAMCAPCIEAYQGPTRAAPAPTPAAKARRKPAPRS